MFKKVLKIGVLVVALSLMVLPPTNEVKADTKYESSVDSYGNENKIGTITKKSSKYGSDFSLVYDGLLFCA